MHRPRRLAGAVPREQHAVADLREEAGIRHDQQWPPAAEREILRPVAGRDAMVRRGLASPEHEKFVEQLAAAATKRTS